MIRSLNCPRNAAGMVTDIMFHSKSAPPACVANQIPLNRRIANFSLNTLAPLFDYVWCTMSFKKGGHVTECKSLSNNASKEAMSWVPHGATYWEIDAIYLAKLITMFYSISTPSERGKVILSRYVSEPSVLLKQTREVEFRQINAFPDEVYQLR